MATTQINYSSTQPINNGANGVEPIESRQIFINDISGETKTSDLRHLFSAAGKVTNVEIDTNELNRHFAFVTFETSQGVEQAITKFTTTNLNNTTLVCRRRTQLEQMRQERMTEARCKLFVGNIPQTMTTDELRRDIERLSGRPIADFRHKKGYCFVGYGTPQDAETAKRNLKNAICGGKTLNAEFKKEDPISSDPGFIAVLEQSQRTLYVRDIPQNTDPQNFKKIFEQHGQVRKFTLPTESRSNKLIGYAFIEFFWKEECDKALIATANILIDGVKPEIRISDPPKDKSNNRGGGGRRDRDNHRRSRDRDRDRDGYSSHRGNSNRRDRGRESRNNDNYRNGGGRQSRFNRDHHRRRSRSRSRSRSRDRNSRHNNHRNNNNHHTHHQHHRPPPYGIYAQPQTHSMYNPQSALPQTMYAPHQTIPTHHAHAHAHAPTAHGLPPQQPMYNNRGVITATNPYNPYGASAKNMNGANTQNVSHQNAPPMAQNAATYATHAPVAPNPYGYNYQNNAYYAPAPYPPPHGHGQTMQPPPNQQQTTSSQQQQQQQPQSVVATNASNNNTNSHSPQNLKRETVSSTQQPPPPPPGPVHHSPYAQQQQQPYAQYTHHSQQPSVRTAAKIDAQQPPQRSVSNANPQQPNYYNTTQPNYYQTQQTQAMNANNQNGVKPAPSQRGASSQQPQYAYSQQHPPPTQQQQQNYAYNGGNNNSNRY